MIKQCLNHECHNLKYLALFDTELNFITVSFRIAVSWFRRSFAGLSLQRHGFVLGSVRVVFLVEKWHCNRFFSEFFSFPCQNHSTVAFHTHTVLKCCKHYWTNLLVRTMPKYLKKGTFQVSGRT